MRRHRSIFNRSNFSEGGAFFAFIAAVAVILVGLLFLYAEARIY